MLTRPADQQFECGAHCAEISPKVDDVCNEQQCHHPPQQPGRIVPPEIMRDAAPSDAANFGCYLLDNDHERKTNKKVHDSPKPNCAPI